MTDTPEEISAHVDVAPASITGALVTALEFYTRLPRFAGTAWCEQDARNACAFAPLAGILVGLLSALVWWLASLLLPEPIPSILALASAICFTGALHEDGLADVCDAFGAPGDAQRTLEILKDPRVGVYGLLGLVLVVLLRLAALWQISVLSEGNVFVIVAALVSAHALSRFAAVYLTRVLAYARVGDSRSRVAAFASPLRGLWLQIALLSTALALLPLWLLGLGGSLFAIAPIVVCGWGLSRLFERRIGGYTGDCLGCMQQAAEVLLLLGVLLSLG